MGLLSFAAVVGCCAHRQLLWAVLSSFSIKPGWVVQQQHAVLSRSIRELSSSAAGCCAQGTAVCYAPRLQQEAVGKLLLVQQQGATCWGSRRLLCTWGRRIS